MANFPNRNLNQTAVYWASPVPDGYGGFTWDDPIEIDCRWVNSTKVILTRAVRGGGGEEIICQAEVQVNQDLDEQGMLYLGSLDDLDSGEEADPVTISTAYTIKRFDKVPTIKGNRFFRKAYL